MKASCMDAARRYQGRVDDNGAAGRGPAVRKIKCGASAPKSPPDRDPWSTPP